MSKLIKKLKEKKESIKDPVIKQVIQKRIELLERGEGVVK